MPLTSLQQSWWTRSAFSSFYLFFVFIIHCTVDRIYQQHIMLHSLFTYLQILADSSHHLQFTPFVRFLGFAFTFILSKKSFYTFIWKQKYWRCSKPDWNVLIIFLFIYRYYTSLYIYIEQKSSLLILILKNNYFIVIYYIPYNTKLSVR